jgi:hypothetical protein
VQMVQQKDHHNRMWDEMGEWERAINQKGITAFEAAEANLNIKSLPGFEVDKTLVKDNYKHISMDRQKFNPHSS